MAWKGSLKEFRKKIKKDINDLSNQVRLEKSKMKYIGRVLAKDIKDRITDGYGVKDTGKSKQAFDPLSEGYIEERKEFKKLSNKTSPEKANNHYTGKMVKSIKAKYAKKGEVQIGVRGAKNLEKQDDLEKKLNREFMFLTDEEIEKADKLAEKLIDKELDAWFND